MHMFISTLHWYGFKGKANIKYELIILIIHLYCILGIVLPCDSITKLGYS